MEPDAVKDEKVGEVKVHAQRLHFLDWLRLIMVIGVVYAHIAVSGLKGGGGFNTPWRLDDRTLIYIDSFRETMRVPPDDPSPFSIRWISVIRQWCLPLLFWVSGAAVGCSYRGGAPRGLDKLAYFSLVGMACNACLWFLSPQRIDCHVDTPDCQGKGILFDFSICPGAGAWFAIFFQMWYTVMLLCLTILNWPMFAAVYGTAGPCALFLQWFISISPYAVFVLASGTLCPDPARALLHLCGLEALFLVLVSLDAPLINQRFRPRWLPVRLLHYLIALVALLQFGAVRWADEMKHIGPAYLGFMSTGFNRFFILGFLMTHARQAGPTKQDTAAPLLSRAWPVTLLLVAFVAPSTNWDLAGMLTYPFFTNVMDRCFYIAGAVMIVFILDRASRGVQCDPLPDILGQTSLMLYLFHPVLITLCLAAGMRKVMGVWFVSMGSMVLLVLFFTQVRQFLKRRCCMPKVPRNFDTLSTDGSPQASELDSGSETEEDESNEDGDAEHCCHAKPH